MIPDEPQPTIEPDSAEPPVRRRWWGNAWNWAGILLVAGLAVGSWLASWPPRTRPRFEILDRIPAGDPKRADRATLAALERGGARKDLPTEVIHYVYFPSEALARQAETEARAAGFRIDVHRIGTEWTLKATHEIAPTEENVAEARAVLTGVAERHGGSYDGWEAALPDPPADRR